MESLGVYLRRKREERGRSVDDLARETRIQAYLLTALEADEFGPLPHPTFVRGFIRNVCRALAAPADRALELYDEALGARTEKLPGVPGSALTPAPEAERSPAFPRGLLARRGSRFSPVTLAVAALIALVVMFFAMKVSSGATSEDRTPAVAWPAGGAATSAWSQTALP